MALTPDEFLNSDLLVAESGTGELLPISFGAAQADKTTKKDYRAAYIYINVTSYSQRSVLRECARKFQISKIPGVSSGGASFSELPLALNLDFVYGHSVGAGVQTYLATRSKDAALFATFLGWTADYDAELDKKGKSSALAVLAVEKFIHFWREKGFEAEWELATFAGKPATELTFIIDCQNGYFHAGHIDAVLRHKRTGRYMVLEIKTTAIRNIDEAQYGNSEQSLGYSVVVDRVAEKLEATAEFEVLYLVYSSTTRTWFAFPFTKSRTQRIDWLQDLLLDHTLINTYRNLEYFPKNGDSCWSFGGRCIHYGVCDLGSLQKTNFKVLTLDPDKSNLPEKVDFFFTLEELTKASIRGKV